MKKRTVWAWMILLLLCSCVMAGDGQAGENAFGQPEHLSVDIRNANACEEAGTYFLQLSGTLQNDDEIYDALQRSVVMLSYTLQLRKSSHDDVETVNRCRLALMEAYCHCGRLLIHRSEMAQSWYMRAVAEAESLLSETTAETEPKRGQIAMAASRLAEIYGMRGEWTKALHVSEMAWTCGWRNWNRDFVHALYDAMEKEGMTSESLPPPVRKPTGWSIALSVVSFLPNAVGEIVLQTGRQASRTCGALCHGEWKEGGRHFLWMILCPVTGLATGAEDAWRGYPFWKTRTLRQLRGRAYEWKR